MWSTLLRCPNFPARKAGKRAFAPLLLHKPRRILLDEAIDPIDDDSRGLVLDGFGWGLTDTTIVNIGHADKAKVGFFTRVLRLSEIRKENVWRPAPPPRFSRSRPTKKLPQSDRGKQELSTDSRWKGRPSRLRQIRHAQACEGHPMVGSPFAHHFSVRGNIVFVDQWRRGLLRHVHQTAIEAQHFLTRSSIFRSPLHATRRNAMKRRSLSSGRPIRTASSTLSRSGPTVQTHSEPERQRGSEVHA